MSSDEVSIHVANLSKRFEMYAQPVDRLKQMVLPKAQRLLHRYERSYFREFWALHGIDFDVHKGETVGIVGRNGSGKSTLLQLICGTLTPTQGTIEVNGRIAALLELGSGFNPEFTGRENVYLNAAVLGLSKEEIEDRYPEIIDFADVGGFVDQPVKTYSSGMYVRLAFAVAINVSPDILVVDEALSVGDEAFQRKCFARIDDIRESGATVLFVSHAAGAVIELCDRAFLLDQGELLAEGSSKYVISRYHKLLYSPAEKYASIRAEILSEMEGAGGANADRHAGMATGQESTDIATNGIGDPSEPQLPPNGPGKPMSVENAYLEEGMAPQSTMRYESSGAVIVDPHIETLSGRRVNMLQSQHKYCYTYTVRFEKAAAAVRCGMLIRSVTGLELAGSVTSWRGDTLPWVEAETELVVRFEFPCAFVSGAYFMNAGVQGVVGEELIYLDRWIDGTMFKVIHEPGRLATTTIDLDIQSTVRATRGAVAQ